MGQSMAGERIDDAWITLMHELQGFVRDNLEQPEVMNELRHWMSDNPRHGATKQEIVRVFELLAPALLVDFLSTNREILNQAALRAWACERENLDETVLSLAIQ